MEDEEGRGHPSFSPASHLYSPSLPPSLIITPSLSHFSSFIFFVLFYVFRHLAVFACYFFLLQFSLLSSFLSFIFLRFPVTPSFAVLFPVITSHALVLPLPISSLQKPSIHYSLFFSSSPSPNDSFHPLPFHIPPSFPSSST